MHIIA